MNDDDDGDGDNDDDDGDADDNDDCDCDRVQDEMLLVLDFEEGEAVRCAYVVRTL